MKIRFNQFELDTEQKTVTGPDGPVVLRAQTFSVLCYLIDRAPAVVGRDELLDAVWGHQATSVSSVAQTIKELRRALGDSSANPRLITTRRRLGYQFVGEVKKPPEAATVRDAMPSSDPSFMTRPRTALSILALAVIGLAVWWSLVRGPAPFSGNGHLPTLAVAEMVNSSDDPELNWIGPALELYLGHALVELGGFRVMAVDRLSETGESQLTGVDFLVEGRYLAAGVEGSRLLASLRRPGSNEIVTSLESGHSGWDVASLSIDMAAAIRDRLGFSAPADADSTTIRSRLPHTPSGQRAYFTAMEAIGNLRADIALSQIALAREHEPDNPRLDHLEALAQRVRGDWRAARAASERALSATKLWPRRDRLELEATAAMLDFDYERAADSLQALTQFYPEPDSNRRLVEALIQSGRLRAAGEALDSLRLKLPRDPRIALLTAELARVQRDHEGQFQAARHAVELVRSGGPEILLPAGLLAEAGALIELGELDAARAVLDELVVLQEMATETERARVSLTLARIQFQQGELDLALAHAKQAELAFSAIPHPAGMAESAIVVGAVHDRAGRLEASVEAMENALALFENLGDKRRLAHANVNFGTTLMRANEPDAAIARLDQAARYFRTVGDRQGEGAALLNHATLLARSGRLIDAEPIFERAREAFEDAGDIRGQAMALGNLAGIAGDRRDMRRSIELAEESLSHFEQLGAQTDIARVSYNLALVHRRRGDLLSAEFRIEQAADAFAGQGAILMQTRALTTLGAILVGMGRFDELDEVLETIDALEIEDPAELSVVNAVLGERALLQGDVEAARDYFDSAHELMAMIGAQNHLLVSRLNLGRVDLAQGRAVAAEQTARELVFAFGEIRVANREIDALLLLAGSLIDQQRGNDAAAALSRAEELLAEFPDAEQNLKLALSRSRISEPALAMERLRWVEQVAGEQGFLPLMSMAQTLQNH